MRMGMGYTLRRYGGWENASDGIETAEGNEEDGEHSRSATNHAILVRLGN